MSEIVSKIWYIFLDTFQAILITASILMVLYAFVLQPNEVSGSSMFPTFKDKELLLSYMLDVKMDKITFGDVVVFHAPTEDDKKFIKRVIGLPGDIIMVHDGGLYRNGKRLDERAYLKDDVVTYPGSFLQEGIEVTVPDGSLIVIGDNRPGSSDSREWGFLPKEKLIGRSLVRIYPFSSFTIIKNPYK